MRRWTRLNNTLLLFFAVLSALCLTGGYYADGICIWLSFLTLLVWPILAVNLLLLVIQLFTKKKWKGMVPLLIDSIGLANIQIYDKLSKQPIITATDVSTTTKQTGVDEEGNPVVEKITSVNKRSVENPLNAQAKANEEALNLYKNQLDTYQKEKIEVADKTRDEFENAATGFLEELKALVLILREDPYALAFYIFLFLFLLCLELLVVTSKTGDSKCDYDLVVEHQLRIKAETLRNTELSLLNKQKEG